MAAEPHPDTNKGRCWRPGVFSSLHAVTMPDMQDELQKSASNLQAEPMLCLAH